ncbi:hypothetical protein K449DRAFT_430680 [Hypoxylon sp. EC38]|nr:hypothetical protein K449DRAFT_430680 [Hypoxylon sp. EC38]
MTYCSITPRFSSHCRLIKPFGHPHNGTESINFGQQLPLDAPREPREREVAVLLYHVSGVAIIGGVVGIAHADESIAGTELDGWPNGLRGAPEVL